MGEPGQKGTAVSNEAATAVQITVLNDKASLRLKSWVPQYAAAAKTVVLGGQELPSQVGAILSRPLHALCTGPGEWLILSVEHPASRVRECFAHDLMEQGLVMVDLTDALAGLEVRGPAARDVLSKGCGLDFHPRSFPAGRCGRTRFAQVAIVIECLEQPSRFELYVARSLRHYLHSWLIDAAAEFTN